MKIAERIVSLGSAQNVFSEFTALANKYKSVNLGQVCNNQT